MSAMIRPKKSDPNRGCLKFFDGAILLEAVAIEYLDGTMRLRGLIMHPVFGTSTHCLSRKEAPPICRVAATTETTGVYDKTFVLWET